MPTLYDIFVLFQFTFSFLRQCALSRKFVHLKSQAKLALFRTRHGDTRNVLFLYVGGRHDDSSRRRHRASFRRTSEVGRNIIRLFRCSLSTTFHVTCRDVIPLADGIYERRVLEWRRDKKDNGASGLSLIHLRGRLIHTTSPSHARRDRSRCISRLKEPFTTRFTPGNQVVRDIIGIERDT